MPVFACTAIEKKKKKAKREYQSKKEEGSGTN